MTRPVLILAERRLGFLSLIFMAAIAVMIARLVQLQFVEASRYEDLVLRSREFKEPVAPRRGSILDRSGRMLAERVERYEITVFPVSFRESNRIDALQDLVAAFLPELLPPDFAIPARGRALQAEAREERFRAIYERRLELVRALTALDPRELDFGRDLIAARLEDLRYPSGELILPPSQLGRRLEQALLLLAANEVCGSRRSLRLRLASSGDLGEALATSAERIVAGIEGEFLALNRIAHDVLPEDPRAFWNRLFSQERRNIGRMERRVVDDLDDQILKVELGTHRLSTEISAEERTRLAAELRLESPSRPAVAECLVAFLAAGHRGELDEEARARLALIEEIVAGRAVDHQGTPGDLPAFADYEVRTLAGLLEVWDTDPVRIGRAFAERFRSQPDFAERRAEYLSPEKEWRRILQHRDGVPFELFSDCSFEVANRVWESFGLRDIGLLVRASEGRRYWEDETGVASLLIGRCNRSGTALGGLEALLYYGERQKTNGRADESAAADEGDESEVEVEDDEESDPTAVATGDGAAPKKEYGPLHGAAGYIVRRRELDRSFTTLSAGKEPVNGRDVRLTIDRDLQKAAEELVEEMRTSLAAGGGAAASVIDLRTGEIIVLASAPRVRGVDYVQRFLDEDAARRERLALSAARRDGAITDEQWRRRRLELRDRLDELALHDRASSARGETQSPPGSVLKPIAAIGMLQDRIFGHDEEIVDPKKGVVDFRRAIEVSSNSYFWEGARRWGAKKLVDWYARFGLGQPIPLLVGSADAEARLRIVRGDSPKNIVIGQGSMNLSTLEVATMMANLARRGDVIVPRIVARIGDEATKPLHGEHIPCDPGLIEEVFDAMEKVAAKSMDHDLAVRLRVAGKTGTAELEGQYKGLYNAWFAGFAPRDNPRYAFALVAERTHSMGKGTAPFAGRLLDLVIGAGE